MAALVTIALDVIDVFVYVADSLRIIQHVEKIQVPSPLKLLDLKPPEEILWDEKQFGEDPGMITAIIQREILEKASLEAYFV
uniref:Uncharacterized protein n=1 Tax=Rhizophora mucronata TaxID=61149 RepID=A0A2P2IYR0_RHIMU